MNLAPNGKPSNLTPKQYRLVRTSAFKNWFGDWENDAENSSKVIDDNGEPLVVWHGGSKFNVFKHINTWKDFYYFYFSDKKQYASYFSMGSVKPYFLNIRNILDATEFSYNKQYAQLFIDFLGKETSRLIDNKINNKKEKFWELLRMDANLYGYLIDEGYNGVTFYEDFSDHNDSAKAYACFNPNQIKLADGKNTTFDGNNPDIRYSDGGKLLADKLAFIKKNEIGYYWLYEINEKGNNYQEVDGDRRLYVVKNMAKRWGYRLVKPKEFNDYYNIPERIRIEYAKGGEVLLAPNGKPSNLTPEQYKLVRTPAFKKWFGDWENSPETASKVIDENGEPLVVYHGTNSEPFVVFYEGSFFTDDYMNADGYASGEMIYEVFLNIKKPLTINARGRKWDNLKNKYGNSTRDIVGQLDMDKYDGVIFNNINDNWFDDEMGDTQNVYFSINPEQIKLADGTNTTFDGNNPDIRYADGGYIGSCVDVGSGKKEVCKYFPDATIMAQYVGNPDENDWGKSKETTSKEFYKFVSKNDVPKKAINGEHSYHYIAEDSYGRDMTINDTAIYFIYNVDSDIHYFFKKTKYELGGELTLTSEQVENKLAPKLLAPNGKPSKLTPEQYRLVRTPEFKKSSSENSHPSHLEIVAFYPNQIKLADGTNTTFDSTNPDIRYSKGGNIGFEHTLKEVYPNIFLLQMTSQNDLANTFARCQAFYEWDAFKGKKFNLQEYFDWYKVNHPDLNSYQEEFYGFNVPSNVIADCYKINDERNEYDKFLLNVISNIKNKQYYLIGALKGDETTLNHELAHAFFWEDESYRNDMTELVNSLYNKKELFDILSKERGYGKNVLIDEAQAFLSTGLIVNISDWEKYREPFKKRFSEQKYKYKNGGLIETLSIEQVERNLGRKINSWKDDVIYISGQKYKKVFLRPEYKADFDKFEYGGQNVCKVGTEVQSLIFSKDFFNKSSAKNWAKEHGYKYDYIDEKENTYRIRQKNPNKFNKDIFRTISFGKGIKSVIACPK